MSEYCDKDGNAIDTTNWPEHFFQFCDEVIEHGYEIRMDSPLAIEATRQSPEHCWLVVLDGHSYLVDSDAPDSELVQGVITETPDLTLVMHQLAELGAVIERVVPRLDKPGK